MSEMRHPAKAKGLIGVQFEDLTPHEAARKLGLAGNISVALTPRSSIED
jgi:hypothetical protein